MMNNQAINSEDLITEVERKIRSNEFQNKEQLSNYLIDLTEKGFLSQSQGTEQIKRLLALYDSLHTLDSQPLNMEKYKGVGLDDKNFIVSTEQDRILKTMESSTDIENEFKNVQNDIIANTKDAEANANTIYNHMANYQKEESTLIPLSQVNIDDVDLEMLQKIKFFLSNQYINASEYKVDLTNGIFYNTETKEAVEVRKNEATQEYSIYKGNEIVYRGASQAETYGQEETNNQELDYEREEEVKAYESRSNVKKRVLKPQHYNNNAAFSKMSFLILNIITFIALITMIILLNK